jgi:hypothetical protein
MVLDPSFVCSWSGVRGGQANAIEAAFVSSRLRAAPVAELTNVTSQL